jgi:hypothetical protein
MAVTDAPLDLTFSRSVLRRWYSRNKCWRGKEEELVNIGKSKQRSSESIVCDSIFTEDSILLNRLRRVMDEFLMGRQVSC